MDRRAALKVVLGGAATMLGPPPARAASASLTTDPRERRLANVRQLTAGGSNAEAYFDTSGTRLIFQSTRAPFGCDQIFTMGVDGGDLRLLSTGRGRTTCPFFFPDGKRFVYASTHLGGQACPAPPDRSTGYVWPIYPSYDIFSDDAAAPGASLGRLTDNDGYDAEAGISPDGRRIVFTSLRAGDLDLYTMAADGSDVRRLTDRPGYDGGAFYSWDGRHIVFRASRPDTAEELEEYRALLARGLVRPRRLEIFSSNLHDPSGRSFALYLVNVDGSGLERITWAESFASFPMFSRDGTRLVFCGSRNAASPREMNVFLADWVNVSFR